MQSRSLDQLRDAVSVCSTGDEQEESASEEASAAAARSPIRFQHHGQHHRHFQHHQPVRTGGLPRGPPPPVPLRAGAARDSRELLMRARPLRKTDSFEVEF